MAKNMYKNEILRRQGNLKIRTLESLKKNKSSHNKSKIIEIWSSSHGLIEQTMTCELATYFSEKLH